MDVNGIRSQVVYNSSGVPSGIVLSGTVQDNNGPVNGVQIDAWAASRFTSTPVLGAPIPSDGIGADIGPVISGPSYGANGSWQLTTNNGIAYYVRALYQNTNYWQLTNEALLISSKNSSGSGAPTASGTRGDIYFRTDTPTTANQRIYINSSATTGTTWIGIV